MEQLDFVKRELVRVFARSYEDEDDYATVAFTEVWNSATSDELPWESLKKLESSSQEEDDYYDYREDDYADRYEVEDLLAGIDDHRITDWESS
ncbi:hypothetical protein IQ250_26865 [Pseudanabaenaceae cyanobacterium LEGE 13415]|nr:hypothetical protein [Pseudanabaenaceae cyanobacterium LEGE 13415]